MDRIIFKIKPEILKKRITIDLAFFACFFIFSVIARIAHSTLIFVISYLAFFAFIYYSRFVVRDFKRTIEYINGDFYETIGKKVLSFSISSVRKCYIVSTDDFKKTIFLYGDESYEMDSNLENYELLSEIINNNRVNVVNIKEVFANEEVSTGVNESVITINCVNNNDRFPPYLLFDDAVKVYATRGKKIVISNGVYKVKLCSMLPIINDITWQELDTAIGFNMTFKINCAPMLFLGKYSMEVDNQNN